MCGQPGHNTQPHVRLPPSFLGMDIWMTLHLKGALIRKLRGSLMCLVSLFFDMPCKAVCTTRHWEASGRLVQEVSVCTVHDIENELTDFISLYSFRFTLWP